MEIELPGLEYRWLFSVVVKGDAFPRYNRFIIQHGCTLWRNCTGFPHPLIPFPAPVQWTTWMAFSDAIASSVVCRPTYCLLFVFLARNRADSLAISSSSSPWGPKAHREPLQLRFPNSRECAKSSGQHQKLLLRYYIVGLNRPGQYRWIHPPSLCWWPNKGVSLASLL